MTTLTDGYRPERNWPQPRRWSSFHGGIVGGALAVLLIGLGLTIYGCAKNGQGLTTLGVGAEHSVKIESLAEQTKSELKPVRTNSDGKVRLRNSIENQDQIIENSRATRKAMADANKDHDTQISAANKKYDTLDAKWYVRWGRVIDRWLRILKWTVIIVFVVGLGLKFAGLNISGFTGSSLSYIGSGLLHMIPWVGGIISEWFANAWFRDRQAKVAAKAPPVVEVPTSVDTTANTNGGTVGIQTTPDMHAIPAVPIAAAPTFTSTYITPAPKKRTTTKKRTTKRK